MRIKTITDRATGNTLVIEKTKVHAYQGATNKIDCYRVIVKDEEDFVFHINCYETLDDAIVKIAKEFPYFEI